MLNLILKGEFTAERNRLHDAIEAARHRVVGGGVAGDIEDKVVVSGLLEDTRAAGGGGGGVGEVGGVSGGGGGGVHGSDDLGDVHEGCVRLVERVGDAMSVFHLMTEKDDSKEEKEHGAESKAAEGGGDGGSGEGDGDDFSLEDAEQALQGNGPNGHPEISYDDPMKLLKTVGGGIKSAWTTWRKAKVGA
jgi:hypothetical protein